MKLEAFTNLLSHLKFENWPIISRVTSLLAEVAFRIFSKSLDYHRKMLCFPLKMLYLCNIYMLHILMFEESNY